MLLVNSEIRTFNLDEIGRGTLIFARHKSWDEGQAGIVTEASGDLLRVQYPPSIQNVLNHYFIPVSEIEEWEVRYSNDGLETVMEYPEQEGDAE